MHAGGGAPGTAHAQQRHVSVCQEFNDREQWRKLWKESTKVCARAR